MSKILCEMYSIRKGSLETRVASAENLNTALYNWRCEVAHFLDLDPLALSELYRRQHMALRLSYSYALALLHRPFLLDSFDGQPENIAPVLRVNVEQNVNRCINASLDVVKIIDAMYNAEESFNASWVRPSNLAAIR
jgi:hypothetical protein